MTLTSFSGFRLPSCSNRFLHLGRYCLRRETVSTHGQGITFGFAVCPEVEAEGSESEDFAFGTVLTDDSVCGLATERLDLMALRSASGIGSGVSAATECF